MHPSTEVEVRCTPREAINYQGRAGKEKEEDSRCARIDTFKSARRLSRRIPMRTGPGPQYLTEFIRHCWMAAVVKMITDDPWGRGNSRIMKYGQYGLAPLPNAMGILPRSGIPLWTMSTRIYVAPLAHVTPGPLFRPTLASVRSRPAVKKTILGSLRYVPGQDWKIAKKKNTSRARINKLKEITLKQNLKC